MATQALIERGVVEPGTDQLCCRHECSSLNFYCSHDGFSAHFKHLARGPKRKNFPGATNISLSDIVLWMSRIPNAPLICDLAGRRWTKLVPGIHREIANLGKSVCDSLAT